jgi:hypothetical protein
MLIDYHPHGLSSIGTARGWVDPDRMELLLKMTWDFVSVIDRTHTLKLGIPLQVLDPIPPYQEHFTLAFDDLMRWRALDLIHEGRQLVVYFSGGIDSCGALVALFEAGIRHDQLVVAYSLNSIAEYPVFFERYIDPLPKLCRREIRPSLYPDINYQELIVSGECGDQLFGSVVRELENDYSKVLNSHWHMFINLIYGPRLRDKAIEMFEPLNAKAPFPIQTIRDFTWWLKFTCKWQHTSLRMAAAAPDFLAAVANLRNFYQTPLFQQWSLDHGNHVRHKTGPTFESYKLALKRYIRAFTGDNDYFHYKTKVPSLPYMPTPLMTLSDGTRILSYRRFSPERYEQKYGDKYDYIFKAQGV